MIFADSVGFALIGHKGGQWSGGSYEGGQMFVAWSTYESPAYDYIFPESVNLSRDGKNVSFTVQDTLQKEHVVVNGHMLEGAHDFVFDRMKFSPDGKFLAFNSVDSTQIYLNVVKVPRP